jgi:prepilin-type N-terminal cleavage/methylation domain-containing protein/prepilin-type processing-associated H-X9-DG protein
MGRYFSKRKMKPLKHKFSHPILSHYSTRKAFTLIELLVVIAVIGILAAILIPVVGAVRERALTTACASNLRQIGVAIQLFTTDHSGRYPGPAWISIQHDISYRNTSEGYYTLTQYLAPYLLKDIKGAPEDQLFEVDVAICPAYEHNFGPPAGEQARESHYQRHPSSELSPFGGRQSDGSFEEAITIYNVEEELGMPASQVISVFDKIVPSGGYGPSPDNPVHGDGRNFLFLDGRVAFIEGEKLPY